MDHLEKYPSCGKKTQNKFLSRTWNTPLSTIPPTKKELSPGNPANNTNRKRLTKTRVPFHLVYRPIVLLSLDMNTTKHLTLVHLAPIFGIILATGSKRNTRVAASLYTYITASYVNGTQFYQMNTQEAPSMETLYLKQKNPIHTFAITTPLPFIHAYNGERYRLNLGNNTEKNRINIVRARLFCTHNKEYRKQKMTCRNRCAKELLH